MLSPAWKILADAILDDAPYVSNIDTLVMCMSWIIPRYAITLTVAQHDVAHNIFTMPSEEENIWKVWVRYSLDISL